MFRVLPWTKPRLKKSEKNQRVRDGDRCQKQPEYVCWVVVGCVKGNFSSETIPLDGWTGQDTRHLIRSRSFENELLRNAGEGPGHSSSVVPEEYFLKVEGRSMCLANLPDSLLPILCTSVYHTNNISNAFVLLVKVIYVCLTLRFVKYASPRVPKSNVSAIEWWGRIIFSSLRSVHSPEEEPPYTV